jgi:cell division protein YceG involved in septum cleavage
MINSDWSGVARDVMQTDSWTWIIFVSFIVVTAFILYSLIIAVICDAVSESEHSLDEEQKDKEEALTIKRLQEMDQVLSERLRQQQIVLSALQAALSKLESEDGSQSTGLISTGWLKFLVPPGGRAQTPVKQK